MNEFEVVHLIWLLGALILVAGGLAGHQLSWKRGLVMVFTWFGIFALVTLFFDLFQ